MMMHRFLLVVVMLISCVDRYMAKGDEYTLESLRASLVRQEDTIIFDLIERARFPLNSPTYDQHYASIPHFSGSLFDFILNQTEDIQAKFLHPASALVNINKSIKEVYFHEILPLFAATGDDGNYAQTATSDILLLQAISRRIHYGKFVAEVKFKKSPHDYEPLIRAKNKEAILKLLTVKSVEDIIVKRVEKKAMMFGQNVSLDNGVKGKYKVDPTIVSRLYRDWIIPMTKTVEVEYLLRCLD